MALSGIRVADIIKYVSSRQGSNFTPMPSIVIGSESNLNDIAAIDYCISILNAERMALVIGLVSAGDWCQQTDLALKKCFLSWSSSTFH